MDWIWKRLAPYVNVTTTVELSGISADDLQRILHQEALERLRWVEAVVFSEETEDSEKIQAVQARFLEDRD